MNLILTLSLLLSPALAIRASSRTNIIPYAVSNEFTCNLAYTNNHWKLDAGFSCPFKESQTSEYQDPWTEGAYQACQLKASLGGISNKHFSFNLTFGTRVSINGFNNDLRSITFQAYKQCQECRYMLYDNSGKHVGGQRLQNYYWEIETLKTYSSSQKVSQIIFWCNNPENGVFTREDDYQIQADRKVECYVPKEGWIYGCTNYYGLLMNTDPNFLAYFYKISSYNLTTPEQYESQNPLIGPCNINFGYKWGQIALTGGWGDNFTLKDVQKYNKVTTFYWYGLSCDRCYLFVYNSSGTRIGKIALDGSQGFDFEIPADTDYVTYLCSTDL